MSCSTTTSECSPSSAEEQLGGALGFLVGHAGHRLVEQQQLRVLHQQHADLQPLLLAVAQQAGGALRARPSGGCASAPRRCGRAARRSGARTATRARGDRPRARVRGSRTPSAARRPWASGTCGRCRSARCRARFRRSRSMLEPKKMPCRRRAFVLPVMQSIIVVLPAPLGPMMQRSSPTLMVSDSAFSALKPSKLTVMSSRYSATPWAKSGHPGAQHAARRRRRGRRQPVPSARPCAAQAFAARDAFFHQVRRHASFFRLQQADEPVRQEQRHRDEQRAEEVQPELRERPR